MIRRLAILGGGLVAASLCAHAQSNSFDDRFYIAPQLSWGFFDDQNENQPNDSDIELDDSWGYGLSFGKPVSKWLNLEAYYFRFDDAGVENTPVNAGNPEITVQGYGLTGLFFPIPDAYRIYVLGGYAAGDYSFSGSSLSSVNSIDKDADHFDIGLGYIHEVHSSGVAIRGEYRYRITDPDDPGGTTIRFDDDYDNHVVSVYLQVPIGEKPVSPPRPDKPAVAEPAPVGDPPAPVDTDGDGVPDSLDECPGTPAGTKVDQTGCPIKKVEPIILKGVNFEFNSAQLTSEATARLDNVVNALSSTPSISVRVEGHTDSLGSASYNLKLSKERAASVRQYLISRGISAERLTSEGYGEGQPIAANRMPNGNDNPAGRAKNRRVELEVVDQ